MTDKERTIARQTAIRARRASETAKPESAKPETRQSAKTDEERRKAYSDMLRQTETAITSGDEDERASALYNLANTVALSVVKKCIDPQRKGQTVERKGVFTDSNGREIKKVDNSGYSDSLVKIRGDITRDRASLDAVQRANEVSILDLMTFNEDGERVDTKESKRAKQDLLDTIFNETIGDGLDLVHDAIVTLLEETRKADSLESGYLETKRTETRIAKRVIIKSEDSKKRVDYETSPIRETFRAVRASVETSPSVQIDNGKYSYLDTTIEDEDGNEFESYIRLPKYYDLGGEVRDFNGGQVAYTTDIQSVQTVSEIVETLNLTTSQAQVLELRLKGYGQKAIASYLGIAQNSVKDRLKYIQKKAKQCSALVPFLDSVTSGQTEKKTKSVNGKEHSYFVNNVVKKLSLVSDITTDSVKTEYPEYNTRARALFRAFRVCGQLYLLDNMREVEETANESETDRQTLETARQTDRASLDAMDRMFREREEHTRAYITIDREESKVTYLPTYTNPKSGQREFSGKDITKTEKKAETVDRTYMDYLTALYARHEDWFNAHN